MSFKLLIALSALLLSKNTLSQSKIETIEWLNAKFENAAEYDVAGEPGVNFLKQFLKINHDGSFTITYKTYKDLYGKPVYSYTQTGHLKNINPETISVSKSIGYSFNAICTNSKKCLTTRFTDKTGKIKTSTKSHVEFGPIYISSDPDLENRIVKALKHLIELYGGKTDTF